MGLGAMMAGGNAAKREAHDFYPTPNECTQALRVSAAHKAFVKVIRELQPKLVIMNGDALDGAGISRFPPIGWEDKPDLVDEIEECKMRLGDIELAAPKAKHVWTLGNHDARFETRLATVAPQYAKINGIHLRDHFPSWIPAWSAWINDDVVVKHRYKGGIHAVRNNTLNGGKTFVTGHLHSLGPGCFEKRYFEILPINAAAAIANPKRAKLAHGIMI